MATEAARKPANLRRVPCPPPCGAALLQTGAAAMTCAATAAQYDALCTKLKKISHLEGSRRTLHAAGGLRRGYCGGGVVVVVLCVNADALASCSAFEFIRASDEYALERVSVL